MKKRTYKRYYTAEEVARVMNLSQEELEDNILKICRHSLKKQCEEQGYCEVLYMRKYNEIVVEEKKGDWGDFEFTPEMKETIHDLATKALLQDNSLLQCTPITMTLQVEYDESQYQMPSHGRKVQKPDGNGKS